jgi:hypothetical protein
MGNSLQLVLADHAQTPVARSYLLRSNGTVSQAWRGCWKAQLVGSLCESATNWNVREIPHKSSILLRLALLLSVDTRLAQPLTRHTGGTAAALSIESVVTAGLASGILNPDLGLPTAAGDAGARKQITGQYESLGGRPAAVKNLPGLGNIFPTLIADCHRGETPVGDWEAESREGVSQAEVQFGRRGGVQRPEYA